MKKIIQLILLFVLFLFSIIFYKSFFQENNQVNEDLRKQEDQNLSNKQNNLIKNLRYDVKFDNNTQYTISSELSELTYENEIEGEIEIVKMQKVSAIFIGSNNIPLIISSDKAIYNNSTYNTNFIDNVIVEYLDHTIKSEKLDMNFTKNIVLISDNVVYEGSEGLVNTDNIIINLESKNAKVFMNKQKDKVEVTSK